MGEGRGSEDNNKGGGCKGRGQGVREGLWVGVYKIWFKLLIKLD